MLGIISMIAPAIMSLISRSENDYAESRRTKAIMDKMTTQSTFDKDEFMRFVAKKFIDDSPELEALKAQVSIAVEQAKIREIDAKSNSFFQYGWVSTAGWASVIGYIYGTMVLPTLNSLLSFFHITLQLQIFDVYTLISVLTGMLGLGVMKTYTKVKEVNRKAFFEQVRAAQGRGLDQRQVDILDKALDKAEKD